ncbi:MAG: very short patch repair endonuclease [Candidatus Aenigmarchaeota archaeon]|nr:very short patch repair endonuclease [Candidatus Aenigmarchaeota archaeon]
MADIFTKEVRSKIMSKIKGKDTKPEIFLRKVLFRLGYRYSLRYKFKELNFKPDMVMVSRKICVFMDGCFWHGCSRCYKEPKSNRDYWVSKINRNIERDKEQNEYLKKNGWKVIRVWEHDLKENPTKTIIRVIREIDESVKK